MNNYEKIKGMSIEEMAMHFDALLDGRINLCPHNDCETLDSYCTGCIVSYLQQEAN